MTWLQTWSEVRSAARSTESDMRDAMTAPTRWWYLSRHPEAAVFRRSMGFSHASIEGLAVDSRFQSVHDEKN